MKKVIIIQARMKSVRLPGKVLEPIEGIPLFGHVVRRMRKSVYFDDVVLATTKEPEDDELADYAGSEGVAVYRGSVADVLARYYHAAKEFGADVIARITSDDPFKDPAVLDKVARAFNGGRYDYVSNTIEPSYPEGLDVEIFSKETLAKCFNEANKAFEREHVTPYIWMHPDKFSMLNIKCEKELSHMRWTVDTKKDLIFAREIYKKLYPGEHLFGMAAIVKLLENDNALMDLMPRIKRNQGLRVSIEEKK